MSTADSPLNPVEEAEIDRDWARDNEGWGPAARREEAIAEAKAAAEFEAWVAEISGTA